MSLIKGTKRNIVPESTLVDEWGLSVVKTPAGSYVTKGYVAMPDGEKDTIVPLVHAPTSYFFSSMYAWACRFS